jgi:hypothetical protein
MTPRWNRAAVKSQGVAAGRKIQCLNMSLQPALAVPGHMAAGTALDESTIVYTRDYLKRFESELPKAKNADDLIAAMKAAYPKSGLGIALDIGAKVNKGEMPW